MNIWVKTNGNGSHTIRTFTKGDFFHFEALSGFSYKTTPNAVPFSLDRNLLLSADVDNLTKALNKELCLIFDEFDDSIGTNLAIEFIELLTEDSTRWLVKAASELTVNFIIEISYVDDYEFTDCASFSDADDFYQQDYDSTDTIESVIVATAWISSALDFTLSEHDYAHYVLKWGVPANA